MKKTSATPKDLENFKKRYLEYAPKNIIRDGGTMFAVLVGHSLFYGFRWEMIAMVFAISLAFGFGNIAYHRFMHKKGNLYIPPSPKYGHKTYAEHQADKVSKSIDA